jgi:hypothetical protein
MGPCVRQLPPLDCCPDLSARLRVTDIDALRRAPGLGRRTQRGETINRTSSLGRQARTPTTCSHPRPRRRRSGPRVNLDGRQVNASGLVGLAGRYVRVGQLLAGRRVTLRLDGDLAHIIDNGLLVRTLPTPMP